MAKTKMRLCTCSDCVFNIIAEDGSPMCGLKEIILDNNGQCVYRGKKLVDKKEYSSTGYHTYSTGWVKMVDAKRLKKEYMAIRGTYTIKIPDNVEPEQSMENFKAAFETLGYEIEDHYLRLVWKDRTWLKRWRVSNTERYRGQRSHNLKCCKNT